MINTVVISDRAKKELRRIPKYLVTKLIAWVDNVEVDGLEETRKIKGFHDEPLKGKRKGQRSIRLNKAYRAIYTVEHDRIEFVLIQEVNKHEY